MDTSLIDPRVPAELAAYVYASRVLPDGRRIDVYPITFGRARVGIAPRIDSPGYDDVF